MSHRHLIHIATIGLAVVAVAAPVAAAQQDLRSPDAADAANTALTRAHDQQAQDYRSPDVQDTAQGRGTFTAPSVTVVRVAEPVGTGSGGFDWGDAGIGAGGVLALVLIAVGGVLMVTHRRRGGGTPAIG